MADLIFSGLKLAYKAFKAYGDVKAELAEFEEDFEELEMRLHALEPVMNALEGRLNEELTMVLTIAKREQEKANKYTEELFAYCRRFKEHGSQFKAIATALANKAIDSLPDGLREGAQALAPVISKHGPPEKAYAKFAEKLHFLMSSLSAAAAAQNLQGSAPAPASSTTNAKSSAASNAKSSNTSRAGSRGESKTEEAGVSETKAPEITMSAEEQTAFLSEMVEEMVEEDDEDFKAIFLKKFVFSQTIVFGVWIQKIPHVLLVQYHGGCPINLLIMRAPSTKYLVDLQQNGLPRNWRGAEDKNLLMQTCMKLACAELKIPQSTYRRRYFRMVVNKWTIPGIHVIGMFVIMCRKRLNVKDFKMEGNVYHISLIDSQLYVNGQLLLDLTSVGVSTGCC